MSKDYPTVHKSEILPGGNSILFDNPSAFLTFTGPQNENIPVNLILPCYSLRSGFAASKVAPKDINKIKILGNISAFEQAPWRSLGMTSIEKSEVMIICINKVMKGKEQSKYIWVIYKYVSYKDALPTKMLNEDGKWQFTLVRNKACDNSVSREYPKSQRDNVIAGDDSSLVYLVSVGSIDTYIPKEEVLPCYSLAINGYKK